MENLNDILESKEFNEMFDFETERKELEESGWTLEEARSFAKYLIAIKQSQSGVRVGASPCRW